MFHIEPHDGIEKSFKVYDSTLDIEFKFDYDDVDHKRVDLTARLIKQTLNHDYSFIKHALQDYDEGERDGEDDDEN